MRKFTLFLCTLFVMTGAFAMPQKKAIASEKQQSVVMPQVRKATVQEKALPVVTMKSTADVQKVREARRAYAKARLQPKHVVAEGDIQIDCTSPMSYRYYSSYGTWDINASDGVYSVYLSVVSSDSNSPAGTYSKEADFDMDYTYIKEVASNERIDISAASVTITDANNRIDVEATLTDNAGNIYHVTMFYKIPEVEAQETVTASDMDYEEEVFSMFGYNFYTTYLTASDENHVVSLEYDGSMSELLAAGTVAIGSDISGNIVVDGGAAVSFYSGSITVEVNGEGAYHLTGVVLAFNNVEYTLDLTYSIPEASREATITATNVMYADYLESYGLYMIGGYSDDQSAYIVLAINSAQVAGSYTAGDLNNQYCQLFEVAEEEVEFRIIGADLTVTVDDQSGDIHVNGTILAKNSTDATDVVEYTIDITYLQPVVSRQATFTATDQTLSVAEVDYYGTTIWYTFPESADGVVVGSFAYYISSDVAGHYTKDDTYSGYCYIGEVNGTDTTWFYFTSVELDLAIDASNNFALTGTVIARNEQVATDVVEYTINISGVASAGSSSQDDPFEGDATEDFNASFAQGSYDTDYVANGYLYIDAENTDGAVIGLQFIVPAGTTSMPDGVYPINESGAENTVSASVGFDSNGYLSYSLAGFTDEEGYFTSYWFIVSGTVTIANGVVTVEAQNSLGNTVHAVIGMATGIEDVNAAAEAKKFIQNGQLVIRVNDLQYNAQGAILR